MVQFFLHVKSRIFADKDAFVRVEYPVLPRAGEIFWLSQEQEEMLKEMIIEAGNVEYYAEYIKTGYDELNVYDAYEETKSVKSFVREIFDFGEACTVKRVAYLPDGIHVEIGMDEEEEEPLLWIKESEARPRFHQRVIVMVDYCGKVQIHTDTYFGNKEWKFGGSKVVAWMPIPTYNDIINGKEE